MAASSDTFVGRLRELTTLRDSFDQAVAGRGRLVMLAGEPGIGKTRTARELALHADHHGATVLWGHCREEAGAPPYWPWVQIIRAALRGAHVDVLLTELGAGAADITDIVPEIRDRLPGLEPSTRLQDAAEARFRMFESIRQFFASLCRRRTVLLVLDDLHWADAPSLRLFESLASEIAESRLLLVGTYRPTELSRQHPLSDTLGGLARIPHAARIHLAGLSAEEVHALIAAATGAMPPGWLAKSLHVQTEGNPLFLREIVRFLEQQGVLGADRVVPLVALPPATSSGPSTVRRAPASAPRHCWHSRMRCSSFRPHSTRWSSVPIPTKPPAANCCFFWVRHSEKRVPFRARWRLCAMSSSSQPTWASRSYARAQHWPTNRSPGDMRTQPIRRRDISWSERSNS
jgi:AAA ATPase domain